MNRAGNKIALFFFASLLLAAAVFYSFFKENKTETPGRDVKAREEKTTATPASEAENESRGKKSAETESQSAALPTKILLDVPFTPQAPFGKWDEYHEEACEEASVMMLEYYSRKEKLTPEIAEKEIQKMIEFQIKKYGDYRDSDARGIARLAADFYGLKLKVIYDFSPEDLKKPLAEGKPIIIPAAGRILGNPFFTSPGPWYHNLVLVGYAGDEFIANDPGTKRGKNYRYQSGVLYPAIHDFPGKKEDIEKGRKAFLVLE